MFLLECLKETSTCWYVCIYHNTELNSKRTIYQRRKQFHFQQSVVVARSLSGADFSGIRGQEVGRLSCSLEKPILATKPDTSLETPPRPYSAQGLRISRISTLYRPPHHATSASTPEIRPPQISSPRPYRQGLFANDSILIHRRGPGTKFYERGDACIGKAGCRADSASKEEKS